MVDQAERLREMFKEKKPQKPPRKKNLSRVIVVASGKGGVGKTNLVVNLAVAIGQWGQKTIILDTDMGLANVDILMNLKPHFSLVDVIRGHKDLREVMLEGAYNVNVIPGGAGLSEIINLDSHQREQIISRLSYLDDEGDVLLIDCAAGLSRNVLSFIAAADDVIMVTTPEPTAITDVYSIIKIVNNYNLHSTINLVVNMVHSIEQGAAVFKRVHKVCHNFLDVDINFLGEIEYDRYVHKAAISCSPYILQYPRSRAAQCVRRIARRLLFEEDTIHDVAQKKGGFFNRLLRLWSS